MEVEQIEQKPIEKVHIETKQDNLLSNQTNENKASQPTEELQEPFEDKKTTELKIQSEVKELKPKEFKNSKTNKRFNHKSKEVFSPNNKLIQQYKISTESEKERKQYEDKVIEMKNRLKALKKQENNLYRKIKMMSHKENKLEMIKTEKETFKHALYSHKSESKRKLEYQKNKNTKEKIIVSSAVKNAINDSKMKKHADFNLARTEKQIIVSLISDNNEDLGNKNQKKINQIKSEYENFKAEEQRKQREREEQLIKYYKEKKEKEARTSSRLKNQIVELEKLEEQYLESLQNTKIAEIKHSSMLKINNTEKALKQVTDNCAIKKLEFDLNQKDKRAIRSKSTTANGKEIDLKKKINNNLNQGEINKGNNSLVKDLTNNTEQ